MGTENVESERENFDFEIIVICRAQRNNNICVNIFHSNQKDGVRMTWWAWGLGSYIHSSAPSPAARARMGSRAGAEATMAPIAIDLRLPSKYKNSAPHRDHSCNYGGGTTLAESNAFLNSRNLQKSRMMIAVLWGGNVRGEEKQDSRKKKQKGPNGERACLEPHALTGHVFRVANSPEA